MQFIFKSLLYVNFYMNGNINQYEWVYEEQY
jgi:hypothetical protein